MKRVRYQRELVRVQQALFLLSRLHLPRENTCSRRGASLFWRDPFRPSSDESFFCLCLFLFSFSSFYFLTDDPRFLVDHRQRFSVSRCKKKTNARGRETAAPLRRDSRQTLASLLSRAFAFLSQLQMRRFQAKQLEFDVRRACVYRACVSRI